MNKIKLISIALLVLFMSLNAEAKRNGSGCVYGHKTYKEGRTISPSDGVRQRCISGKWVTVASREKKELL